MAKKKSLLVRMKENPKANWSIDDVRKLCRQMALNLVPPSHGSHFKVYSEHLEDVIVIPAKRPIKPIYVKMLVSYAEGHLNAQPGEGDQND